MTNDGHDDVRERGTGRALASMERDDLVALGDALDRRVKAGSATLEDFGELARTRQELARRAEDDGATDGRCQGARCVPPRDTPT